MKTEMRILIPRRWVGMNDGSKAVNTLPFIYLHGFGVYTTEACLILNQQMARAGVHDFVVACPDWWTLDNSLDPLLIAGPDIRFPRPIDWCRHYIDRAGRFEPGCVAVWTRCMEPHSYEALTDISEWYDYGRAGGHVALGAGPHTPYLRELKAHRKDNKPGDDFPVYPSRGFVLSAAVDTALGLEVETGVF